MPNYHDFNPWRKATETIESGMLAVARAKNRRAMWEQEQAAQAPLNAARLDTERAQASNYTASARETNLKADLLAKKAAAMERAFAIAPKVVADVSSGNKETPEMAEFAQIGTAMTGGDSDKLANWMADVVQLQKRGVTASDATRLMMNEADNAAAAARPVELNQNTRLVDPKTGAPIALGNVVLSQGASLFQPGADSVTLSGNPAATGVAPRTTTPRADAIQLQVRADEIKQLNAAILKSTDANEKAIMMRRRNQLMRDLGVPEGGNTPPATNSPAPANLPLTDSTVPAQGGNTPAVRGKVVVQNGYRYQLNPDGSAVPLGPVQ